MKKDSLKALYGKYEIEGAEAVTGGTHLTSELIHTNSSTSGNIGSSDADLSHELDSVGIATVYSADVSL